MFSNVLCRENDRNVNQTEWPDCISPIFNPLPDSLHSLVFHLSM